MLTINKTFSSQFRPFTSLFFKNLKGFCFEILKTVVNEPVNLHASN